MAFPVSGAFDKERGSARVARNQLDTRCVGIGPPPQCTLLSLDYGYDGWGNLTSQSESVGAPGRTETFVYDSLHRLTQATRLGEAAVSYGYDAAGNLLHKPD